MQIHKMIGILYLILGNQSFAYYAYVADLEASSVFVIDTNTNVVIATVTTGSFAAFEAPDCIVSSPDGKTTFVGDVGTSTLYTIDTNSNSPTFNTVLAAQTLPTPEPFSLAISPDGKTIYVGTFDFSSNATIFVFDTLSNTFTGTISGVDPSGLIIGIAFSPDGYYAYAADAEIGVYLIDPTINAVVDVISFPGADSIVFTPDGSLAFVSNINIRSVSILDANPGSMSWNSIIGTINTGSFEAFDYPLSLAINPEGTYLYILDGGHSCVYTADVGTYEVIQQTPVSLGSPGELILPSIAVVPNRSELYIAPTLPAVHVMNTSTYAIQEVSNLTDTPFVTPKAISMAYSPNHQRTFQRPSNRR